MKKIILCLLTISILFSSCIKDTFDEPTKNSGGGGGGTGTLITIKELRAKSVGSITGFKIKGIVISDKANGNTSGQNLIIQDSTAGIAIRFTAAHEFNLNDQVEISINGWTLENYRELLQLNNVELTSAIKVGTGSITPRLATLTEINNNFEAWESTLVKVDSVTISGSPATYSGSKTIADANANITLYTTFTASFASASYKSGKVNVVGYLGQFNSTQQLSIRSEADVTGGTTGGGGGGGLDTLITISSLRSLYGTSGAKISNRSIEGIVISDNVNKNINSFNMVIQDATAGILVRFTGAHTYKLGDKVKVIFNGDSLIKFSGLMEMDKIPFGSATLVSAGNSVTPQTLSIATIIANLDQYESELVTIVNATFSTATSMNGNLDINDGATMKHYTGTTALFKGDAVPTGAKTVTGIVGINNANKQITIRSMSDIQ